MKILLLGNPDSGVIFHRLLMPMIYLMQDHPEDAMLVTNHIDDEVLAKEWDIVMVNRALQVEAKQMLEWKAKYGFKLIVDNDDYWDLDPHHILSDYYKQNNVGGFIRNYMRIADVCTSTHGRLTREISKFNEASYVLPNALPYGDGMFDEYKTESDTVRLFYSGSDTHQQDVALLRNPMKRVYSDVQLRKNISVHVSGYSKQSPFAWSMMLNDLTHAGRFKHKISEFTKPEKYLLANTDSDISLVPLIGTKFNAFKSNLKVLEAAVKKNPAIVSKVDPYLHMPVNYVENQTDWYVHIKKLVTDRSYREDQGEQLHRWCFEHHNLRTINENRYQILKSVL